MKRGKRAQFFLLAAVVISAVIISFGSILNEARINYEGDNFQDFTYEVKRESGSVIDYEIYTLESGNLNDFVDLLGEDFYNRDKDSDYFFVYGSTLEGIEVRNYGKEEVCIADSGGGERCFEGLKKDTSSKVSVGETATTIPGTTDQYKSESNELLRMSCTKCVKECERNKDNSEEGLIIHLGHIEIENSESLDCDDSCDYSNCTNENSYPTQIVIGGQDTSFEFRNNTQIVFIIKKETDSGEKYLATN